MNFDEWWVRFQELAFEADFPLGDQASYSEYYDDGDSPEDALATEMSYAEDDSTDLDDYEDESLEH